MVRKHKKGFTLVELLAVIVILAIILVIAVPQIMKTIDEARKGALGSSAKLIAASAEREYLARKTIGDTDFNPANVVMECNEVAETTSDYTDCSIKFDANGKATVKLKGQGKFKGKYVCAGTREEAVVTDVVEIVVFSVVVTVDSFVVVVIDVVVIVVDSIVVEVADDVEVWGGSVWGSSVWGGSVWGGSVWVGTVGGGSIWVGSVWGSSAPTIRIPPFVILKLSDK